MSDLVEVRNLASGVELRAAGSRTIGGYAAVFNRPSENLGGFIEQVHPRCFNQSRGNGWPGVVCRFNHQDSMLLGTTRSGTLRVETDARGLTYDVDLPESRSDVLESVTRGDVSRSSFAFQCYEDDWRTSDSGYPVRMLMSARLIDVAPVITPAYADATVDCGRWRISRMRRSTTSSSWPGTTNSGSSWCVPIGSCQDRTGCAEP